MNEYETKEITVEIDSELYSKYEYICRYYGHSFNRQLQSTIFLYVHEFERVHGKIGEKDTV